MTRKTRPVYGRCEISRPVAARDRVAWSAVETPPLPRRLTEIITFPAPESPWPPPTENRPMAA